jgi:hypothetical protein
MEQASIQKRIVGRPFQKGNPGGPGRPRLTLEQRAMNREIRKAIKDVREYTKQYKQGLAKALPEISPVLVGKAEGGNVKAIAEIHKVLGVYEEGGKMIVPIQINIEGDREKYQ